MFSWKKQIRIPNFYQYIYIYFLNNSNHIIGSFENTKYSEFGIWFFFVKSWWTAHFGSKILAFWVILKLCSGSPTLLLLPCSSHKLSLIYIYEFEKSRFSETCLDDSRGLADNFIDSFICFSTTAYLLLGIDRGTLYRLKTVRTLNKYSLALLHWIPILAGLSRNWAYSACC